MVGGIGCPRCARVEGLLFCLANVVLFSIPRHSAFASFVPFVRVTARDIKLICILRTISTSWLYTVRIYGK
jgi:hypothetical protein